MNSSDAPRDGTAPRSLRGAIAWVVVTIALLAALVFWLNPPQPNLVPAGLDPAGADCAKPPRAFVPTNLTEISDLPLEGLAAPEKNRVVFRLNMEPCTCGCKLSVAQCRQDNPACSRSAGLGKKLVAQARKQAKKPPQAGR